MRSHPDRRDTRQIARSGALTPGARSRALDARTGLRGGAASPVSWRPAAASPCEHLDLVVTQHHRHRGDQRRRRGILLSKLHEVPPRVQLGETGGELRIRRPLAHLHSIVTDHPSVTPPPCSSSVPRRARRTPVTIAAASSYRQAPSILAQFTRGARVRLNQRIGASSSGVRFRPSDAGPRTIAVPAVVTPVAPAGVQNAPGCTTHSDPAGAGGAVVGSWVAGAPAALPDRNLAWASASDTLPLHTAACI
jgi:hypothetical protein